MNIAIGTCRITPAINHLNSTYIDKYITRPTNSSELLQLIKFLKYKNIKEENFKYIFEYSINRKRKIKDNIIKKAISLFNNENVKYIFEICSKKCNVYNKTLFSHYTASSLIIDKYGKIRSWFSKNEVNNLKLKILSFEEIERDITKIKEELNNKKFIIVGHYVTQFSGDRYELNEWLKKICLKLNIIFIDPIQEIKKNDKNFNTDKYFVKEIKLIHLNKEGEKIMKLIFNNFLKLI